MSKEKILVVDDEQMIRWSLTEALRSWGYLPVEAATIPAGLAVFEAEQPAALLLDINLPTRPKRGLLRMPKVARRDCLNKLKAEHCFWTKLVNWS